LSLERVRNYFNYFTEIEEHFQRRRGTLLLLSTLDWALIETWKDAGIPLEAVVRGIDTVFEAQARRTSVKKVNGLAYCSQEVLAAAEEMKEAAVGTERQSASAPPRETGFEAHRVSDFLVRNAKAIALALPSLPASAGPVAEESVGTLRSLAARIAESGRIELERLEQHLTVLEERLNAALLTASREEDLLAIRKDADREMAPYRSKMVSAQIAQLHKQYAHKRLLEKFNLPRLSLFYMI
jgi:hypothetical protein